LQPLNPAVHFRVAEYHRVLPLIEFFSQTAGAGRKRGATLSDTLSAAAFRHSISHDTQNLEHHGRSRQRGVATGIKRWRNLNQITSY
tara:strand:+ start:626 stop:886 length:261 start_codon:yes stop_codon:yes gene_type:complete